MMSSSVVLPTPLGPMIATRSPARTVRSKFSNSARSPKRLETPRTRSTSSPDRLRAVNRKRTFFSLTGLSIRSIFSSRFSRLSAALMDFSRLYMR